MPCRHTAGVHSYDFLVDFGDVTAVFRDYPRFVIAVAVLGDTDVYRSVVGAEGLGLPILVLLCSFPIIPQIPGDLQKKVNRLIIAAHDNRISDAADELLYMKDGRIEKI